MSEPTPLAQRLRELSRQLISEAAISDRPGQLDRLAGAADESRKAANMTTTSPADFTISRFGRGPCPECGRDISLTKKGKIRVHGAKEPRVWPPMNCSGSGKAPGIQDGDSDVG